MSMHSRSDQSCTRSMQTHSHLNQHTIKEIGNTEKDILCGKKHHKNSKFDILMSG